VKEKISRRNFLGRLGKAFLGVGLVGKVFESEAKANALNIEGEPEITIPPTNTSNSTIAHYNGMTEGFDGSEGSYLESPEPAIDVYIRMPEGFFPDGKSRASFDLRGAESMTNVNYEITGRGLPNPVQTDLNVIIEEILGENNMVNKKVIGKLYQRVDDGHGGFNYNHVGTYDLWNMHESGQKINLTVSEGITRGQDFFPSHKLEISFYNTNVADFNNDGDVNFKDYATLSADFGKPIGNYLTDISGPEGKSDGFVDKFDLKTFVANWLD